MGREVTLFSSKETKERHEIAAFLHDLAGRLEAGQITLRRGADEIVLDLPDSLEVELKWYDEMAPTGAVQLG